MPVLVTDHFRLDRAAFDKTGAFNMLLDMDTLLFIDPALLRTTNAPELKDSAVHVTEHFRKVILVLSKSTKEADAFWNAADGLLTFPEAGGLRFGYSKKGTGGSGMGKVLRGQLLTTAKAIIDAGIQEPEIFELVGLFQENVGADRIGDMVARIIGAEIEAFSKRVFTQLGVIKEGDSLPLNPFGGGPILLAPCDILRDLPVAEDWSDVDRVVVVNQELRERTNALIGLTWKDAAKLPKRDLLDALLKNPDLLRDLVDQYRKKNGEPYDMTLDRAGEVRWVEEGRRIAKEHPIEIEPPAAKTLEELERVVLDICEHFKRFIENNGINKSLYMDGKPLPEAYLQRIFFVTADAYCKANNVDVTPEANSGRGPVDFKFSEGYELRVVVEAKKSTNSHLLHGLETQLPIYQKAEQACRAIYLVVDVGASDQVIKNLKDAFAEAPKPLTRLILVDGLLQPSASKA